ncbi:hypothetical protein INT47_006259 [Mucor saturninus]|uniref:Uncharacterized protein n=1 Tax=Mucor saturninus TaxID=64648 RepID=A0A8H7R097_9FUNG|nr:hypothetical protein INT47_006259 [Mucor saturninus]
MFTLSRHQSTSSSRCSSARSTRSIWSKISNLFHHPRSRSSSCEIQSNSEHGGSRSTLSDVSVKTVETQEHDMEHRRHRKQLIDSDCSTPPMMIPPFSPTYCKNNEFPYSNFYSKLPDGRWMIRYRDGNRDILRTDIMEGYLI